MAFVVFIIVRIMNRLLTIGQEKPKAPEPVKKQCPYCFSEIDIKATRCPACTSQLGSPAGSAKS